MYTTDARTQTRAHTDTYTIIHKTIDFNGNNNKKLHNARVAFSFEKKINAYYKTKYKL